MAEYHVVFTRQISEDIHVLEKKGKTIGSRAFIEQLAEEISPHLVDGVTLRMGTFYERDDNGDNYSVEGFFGFPQEETEEVAAPWSQRLSRLEEFVSYLQDAFDEGVAGLFNVESVRFASRTFPASEIVEKANIERLVSGTHLTQLSPEDIFDRTKRVIGDVALITSGEFADDALHENSTAYAVGRITEHGGFLPIRSHMRLGEATVLFDKTASKEPSLSI